MQQSRAGFLPAFQVAPASPPASYDPAERQIENVKSARPDRYIEELHRPNFNRVP
jgi:hypothetical protein